MKLPIDFSSMRNNDDSGFVFDKVRITSRSFYGNGNFLSKGDKKSELFVTCFYFRQSH